MSYAHIALNNTAMQEWFEQYLEVYSDHYILICTYTCKDEDRCILGNCHQHYYIQQSPIGSDAIFEEIEKKSHELDSWTNYTHFYSQMFNWNMIVNKVKYE